MPASYPTSAKSFTTKNAGDTIQPAHINDLQDEVAAVEAGLLSGVSPLTSSNMIGANLSIGGGSTLATLQVNGDSTIAGTLTVNKILSTSLPTLTTYVRAYAGSPVQYGTASTGTKIGYDQEIADLLSEWDSTALTFTPKSSGYYAITARGQGSVAGLGALYLGIWVNDTLAISDALWGGGGETVGQLYAHGVLNLSSGAVGAVQLRIYCPGSTARLSSGVAVTDMDIIRLF